MREVRFSASAERDLRALEAYWMRRDPELVRDFYAEAKRTLRFLAETPGAGSPVDEPHVRKWKVGRTPFLFFYTFDRRTLRIDRVRHQNENWFRAP